MLAQHGPALAAETARRLACDASVLTLRHDAQGRPLDLGRSTRTVPAALGRALRARDEALRFLDPHGQPILAAPPTTGTLTGLLEANHGHGLRIVPDTATGPWRGEPLDPQMAVAARCAQQARHDAVAC